MPRSRKANSLAAPPDLHRRWRVALADAETNAEAWAITRGISGNHLREVVLGLRKSEHLLRDVIDFVEVRERMIAKRVAGNAMRRRVALA